jgi:hypothetical protein
VQESTPPKIPGINNCYAAGLLRAFALHFVLFLSLGSQLHRDRLLEFLGIHPVAFGGGGSCRLIAHSSRERIAEFSIILID